MALDVHTAENSKIRRVGWGPNGVNDEIDCLAWRIDGVETAWEGHTPLDGQWHTYSIEVCLDGTTKAYLDGEYIYSAPIAPTSYIVVIMGFLSAGEVLIDNYTRSLAVPNSGTGLLQGIDNNGVLVKFPVQWWDYQIAEQVNTITNPGPGESYGDTWEMHAASPGVSSWVEINRVGGQYEELRTNPTTLAIEWFWEIDGELVLHVTGMPGNGGTTILVPWGSFGAIRVTYPDNSSALLPATI
jgi:hypothetical protein